MSLLFVPSAQCERGSCAGDRGRTCSIHRNLDDMLADSLCNVGQAPGDGLDTFRKHNVREIIGLTGLLQVLEKLVS
jgi:hypothetical protein